MIRIKVIKPKTLFHIKLSPISKVLICFIGMWIPLFILNILGVRAKYNDMLSTVNDVYFICAIFLFTVLLSSRRKVRVPAKIQTNQYASKNLGMAVNKIIYSCGVFSLLGAVLLTYDRIVVKGIDYTLGVRNARYQWFGLDASTTIFGAMGNILMPFSYVSLFFCVFYFENIPLRKKIIGILSGVAVPFVHAFLNGGRMNLLVCALFVLTTCLMRTMVNKSFIPKISKTIIYIIAAVFLFYIISVFSESRSFGDTSVSEYTSVQVESLGGIMTRQYNSEFANMLIQIFSYMYHGKWVAGEIMSANEALRYGLYSYVPINSILSRFGINLPLNHNLELLHGAFLNLPGTFFYDFGIMGVLVIPCILAMILVVGVNKYCKKTKKKIGASFCLLFFLMYLLASPIAPFFNMGYVSFISLAYACVYLYLRYIRGIKYLESELYYE